MLRKQSEVRGGISFGEAYIDEEESVFVGKPIVEAYQLEKSQQWAGVALMEKAVERIPERVHLGFLVIGGSSRTTFR
jgi:hypothetical protein